MRPLRLILDYTKAARQHMDTPDYVYGDPEGDKTTLREYYSNGEHVSNFPEVRTPKAGRKAARRYLKYVNQFGEVCVFIDRTKE